MNELITVDTRRIKETRTDSLGRQPSGVQGSESSIHQGMRKELFVRLKGESLHIVIQDFLKEYARKCKNNED